MQRCESCSHGTIAVTGLSRSQRHRRHCVIAVTARSRAGYRDRPTAAPPTLPARSPASTQRHAIGPPQGQTPPSGSDARRVARRPTPAGGRSRTPDGGPQSAADEVVEASEPPGPPHRRPTRTPDRSRTQDGSPPSADDEVVEASEPSESPGSLAPCTAVQHPIGAGRRTAASRVQMMKSSKPASSLPGLIGAGRRTAARRVQMMKLSKPASGSRWGERVPGV